MTGIDRDFRYLNREGQWVGFTLDGLELRGDGALALAGLPAAEAASTSDAPALKPILGAGLARDAAGNVYFSRPDQPRVSRLDGCTGELSELPCVTGPGSHPGELRCPHGLLAFDQRGALLVCDPGNRRVQWIEPHTGQVLEIWSTPLVQPIAAASDAVGNCFLVDATTVRKRSVHGLWDANFERKVDDAALLQTPIGIVVAPATPTERIYVLDAAARAIYVFGIDGGPLLDAAGAPIAIGRGKLEGPICLAVTAHAVYVSDRAADGSTRVLRFQRAGDYAFVDLVPGLSGVSAMLASGEELWIQRGHAPPERLLEQTAFPKRGVLESDVIDVGRRVQWTSFHAEGDVLPPGIAVEWSFRFFEQESAQGPWEVVARDVPSVHVRNRLARFCRVRLEWRGDGASTPVLENLCVRFDQRGYLAQLPAVFGADEATRDFLIRFLALFESMNLELDALIDALPQLFDPASIPQDFLPWLASWLAVELDESWSFDKQRQAIARAYRADAVRGTSAGLRDAIAFELGVDAVIVEPIQHSALWMLPDAAPSCGMQRPHDDGSTGIGALLGLTTMLAASEPDSTVVGTSTLDRTRLLGENDYGVPLFDDTAFHFVAHVYRGAADHARDALVRLIERDKPAHTSYRLLSIEPRSRIGIQACVGFDTVVAGPAEPTPLGTTSGALQLAGDPPARIGAQPRVGQGMRL